MEKELTINLSEETYAGLMDLVGEANASEFIESVLRPYVSDSEVEFEVKLPRIGGKKRIYLRSPRLKNPEDYTRFRVTQIEKLTNA